MRIIHSYIEITDSELKTIKFKLNLALDPLASLIIPILYSSSPGFAQFKVTNTSPSVKAFIPGRLFSYFR